MNSLAKLLLVIKHILAVILFLHKLFPVGEIPALFCCMF